MAGVAAERVAIRLYDSYQADNILPRPSDKATGMYFLKEAGGPATGQWLRPA
jgi:hypothetical protein